MSSFDNWPSATSSFDDAPSRSIESAVPEFRSDLYNPMNPGDLSTMSGRTAAEFSDRLLYSRPLPQKELSGGQFGAMIAFGLIGAVIISLIF